MKRPIGIMAVTIGLLLNTVYQVYNTINAYLLTSLAWAGVGLVAAYGVYRMRRWSPYVVTMLAVFAIAGWADLTMQSYGKGWPHRELAETIISFVPAAFLLSWWVCASIFTICYFRKHEET